jgi:hypothetical protein
MMPATGASKTRHDEYSIRPLHVACRGSV